MKMQKAEIEIIRFESQDIIVTSLGLGDTLNLASKQFADTTENAHDSLNFSAGVRSLWNRIFN